MGDQSTRNEERPDSTLGEDQGGKVNVPTAVVSGVAALIGGYLGARAGSSGADTASALLSAVTNLLS